MLRFFRWLIMALLAFLILSPQAFSSNPKRPKRVILMIGDGMGLAQLYATQVQSPDKLTIFKLPVMGMVETRSANDFVTDSAAGGTALATGTKTNNGVIGLDPMLKPVSNLVELCEKKGLATGLVVSSPMTHATPASFVAHNPSRKNAEAIALDFLKLDIEFLAGGGRNHFSNRADGLNLLDSLKQNGYQVITDTSALKSASGPKTAALVFPDDPPYYLKGRANYLPNATALAIKNLEQSLSFFLMVEGSQIDWACHDNHLDTMMAEVRDFDQAVKKAYDFALRDGNTLLIVTADHETGGLSLSGMEANQLKASWSSKEHTGICVPIFSLGPGSQEFSGLMDNTLVFKKIAGLLELPVSN